MTVRELIHELLNCDDLDATVTIGQGCGPVSVITETVNRFVILDPPRQAGL